MTHALIHLSGTSVFVVVVVVVVVVFCFCFFFFVAKLLGLLLRTGKNLSNGNLVPRSHSVLHVGDLGTRLGQ